MKRYAIPAIVVALLSGVLMTVLAQNTTKGAEASRASICALSSASACFMRS